MPWEPREPGAHLADMLSRDPKLREEKSKPRLERCRVEREVRHAGRSHKYSMSLVPGLFGT